MEQLKILIVKDEAVVRLHLQRVVEAMGYTVTGVAASSEKAYASAAVARPDPAVMDLNLRGDVDGIDAATLLRVRHGIAVTALS